VEDPKRLIQAILCCSFALALWPSQAAAQRHGHPVRPSSITSTTPVLVNEQFFIAEPQIDALWRINGWLRLDAGVRYRAIGGADLLHDQLRGVSGTIAVRFGGH
jgi:hypothetical protein